MNNLEITLRCLQRIGETFGPPMIATALIAVLTMALGRRR